MTPHSCAGQADRADSTDGRPHCRRRHRGGGVGLTPMIDVTFLLLIFFVIATQFVKPEGLLTAKLPQVAVPPPVTLELPIVVRLTEPAPDRLAVSVDGQAVPAGDLEAHLATLRRAPIHRSRPVALRVASDVSWNHVEQVYNTMLVLKVENLRWDLAGG